MSMNATLPKLTGDLHRVGGGYSVQFSTRNGRLECRWTPDMPSQLDLRRKVDMMRYEAARESFIVELQRCMGGPVAVISVEGARDE